MRENTNEVEEAYMAIKKHGKEVVNMASFSSADVLCPYYEKDIPKTCSLVCEGILPGSRMKCYFPDREAIRTHMGRFCTDDYRACPWSRILELKWS